MLFFNNADYLTRVARRPGRGFHAVCLRACKKAAPPAVPVSSSDEGDFVARAREGVSDSAGLNLHW